MQGLAIAAAGVVIGEVLAIPALPGLAATQVGIRPVAPSTQHCHRRRVGACGGSSLLRAGQSRVACGSDRGSAPRVNNVSVTEYVRPWQPYERARDRAFGSGSFHRLTALSVHPTLIA